MCEFSPTDEARAELAADVLSTLPITGPSAYLTDSALSLLTKLAAAEQMIRPGHSVLTELIIGLQRWMLDPMCDDPCVVDLVWDLRHALADGDAAGAVRHAMRAEHSVN